MYLKDLDLDAQFNLAGVPLKGASSPAGYTAFPKGRGTYHAKEHLKKLGGYWSKESACWFVPSVRADQARTLIKDAEAGRLTADPLPVDAAPGVLTCWECGERHYVREVVTRGGNAEQFYCGCATAKTITDPRMKRAVR